MGEGDCLRLTLHDDRAASWEFGFRLTREGRAGVETTYEVRLPFVRPSALALKVDDSDGEGRDLWMGLADPVALRYR